MGVRLSKSSDKMKILFIVHPWNVKVQMQKKFHIKISFNIVYYCTILVVSSRKYSVSIMKTCRCEAESSKNINSGILLDWIHVQEAQCVKAVVYKFTSVWIFFINIFVSTLVFMHTYDVSIR